MLTKFKRYWVLLFMIPVALIVFFKVLKTVKSSPINVEATADKLLSSNNITTSKREELKNITMQLAHNLGTAHKFWNPQSWTENDSKVYQLLKTITQSDFNIIKSLYFEVYAKGNTLTVDLAKLLDTKYYIQLNLK